MTRRLGITLTALGAIVLANSASANLKIQLSDFASEPIDPSILAASFEFSVTGQTLTLTVTNNTSVPNEYSINRIYFNANANVGNLVSSSTGQFDLNAISGNADGFGMFDFVLSHGPDGGENHHIIKPTESEVFTFTFTGVGFDETDFTHELSAAMPGNKIMIVAAKFVMGPNDDSAFGANPIPEPGAIVLISVAGLLAGRRRRR